MVRAMAAPPGALQRAALVAVPLVLVVIIVVTPSMLGREQPATSIPFLRIEAWGDAPNETAMLYIRSALGVTRYAFLELHVRGVGDYEGTTWSRAEADAPSLWLKFAADKARMANVTALAVEETAVFRYNLTLEVASDADGPLLRVLLEDEDVPREFRETFTASMKREALP